MPADLVFSQPSSEVWRNLVFSPASTGDESVGANLVFSQPSSFAWKDLVFAPSAGEVEGLDAVAVLRASLPRLSASGRFGPVAFVGGRVPLPAFATNGKILYASNTQRPLVCRALTRFEAGEDLAEISDLAWYRGLGVRPGFEVGFGAGGDVLGSTRVGYESGDSLSNEQTPSHDNATSMGAGIVGAFDSTISTKNRVLSEFQAGAHGQGVLTVSDFQGMLRDHRPARKSVFQGAKPAGFGRQSKTQRGVKVLASDVSPFEAAIRPNGGKLRVDPPPTPDKTCYTRNGQLVFSFPKNLSKELLFLCDNAVLDGGSADNVVVAVRRVYIVTNSILLRKVSNGRELVASSFSMGLDCDSWTWRFSANLPGSEQPHLEPVGGVPVEVEAVVNGQAFRLVVESLSRSRAFAQSGVSISGRGKSAALAAPYSPIRTFANSEQRTAQQLVNDALTNNGISIGWDVEWGLTDWAVPAGAWSVRGSFVDAVNSVAQSAGGYVQPHATLNRLRVLPKYPYAPWEWGAAAPDITLPSAVTVRESIEWKDSASYNRVFVSGQNAGILARVTRAGTGGDLLAPMVTDSLITHADAARQRGLSILGASGRQAVVSLTLPVLPQTGVIQPGKFIKYTDGTSELIGLSRGVSVSANGAAALSQTVTLEVRP